MGLFNSRGRSDSLASAPVGHIAPSPYAQEADAPGAAEETNSGRAPSQQRSESTAFGGSSMRIPGRSFYHGSFSHSMDPAHYSSSGLRAQTAELASYALSLKGESFLGGPDAPRSTFGPSERPPRRPRATSLWRDPVAAPGTVAASDLNERAAQGPSSALWTQSTEQPSGVTSNSGRVPDAPEPGEEITPLGPPLVAVEEQDGSDTENTPLLRETSRPKSLQSYGKAADVESQVPFGMKARRVISVAPSRMVACFKVLSKPASWDRRTIWREGVVYPASLLPAVFLGLLLNVLDALSYGMILFPLGEAIFADLGSDGISMFYVSCIVSQLVFSGGASVFKGGVGSEMIEVVPFFHKMAFMILNTVGEDNPKSVLATTILSFSISSVLTGLVFFLLGTCKLGSLIGFFPRHILIGCIGGVGWFLLATGIEVSARLPASLQYDLPTLQKLFQLDTVFLWLTPVLLAVGLLVLKRFIRSNFLVGLYFIAVVLIFYLVTFTAKIPMDALRNSGWVFDAPSSSKPWYHFYTLYDFSAVDWSALLDTVPAMFALTFFGLLHVPINVPALGISTGEDNLNVDRELIAHGVTNALSGCLGSIQNYLAYTNSLLFIDSGGNSRLAGIMLGVATAGILVIGPAIVGFIPIMIVGALIFMLGIELLEEALVDTWGKLHRLEYLTVLIIVVTMGAWDFVIGILVGIILACVNFVVQTSQKSAIRATYSGQISGSTVRRPPIQQRYLKEAGQQTLIIKLAGYLFFGTIVKVESTMRGLIEEEAFRQRPIRFLILDFSRVYGMDFSAAEAFTRINRILKERSVQTVISGLNVQGDVGKSLQNVGLFNMETGVQIFEDLNSALEHCENEYLQVFYHRKEILLRSRSATSTATVGTGTGTGTEFLDVPGSSQSKSKSPLSDGFVGSPRGQYLQRVATTTLHEDEAAVTVPPAWSAMRQPLPLLLQTFQGLTAQKEDFWFPICAYFTRQTHPAGSILYEEGEMPQIFFLLESGMLRAEYDLPQGRFFELIVAGGPCGELPFFSETRRTATVKAEQDCVTWCLELEKWKRLREEEPRIAQELLTVTLKLTSERMESITSYVLMMAA